MEHDMRTRVAATAFVRLTRAGLEDGTSAVALLRTAKFSVATGGFEALGADRMAPCARDRSEFLEIGRRFGDVRGYDDPRRGLAVACAGWGATPEARGLVAECQESKSAGTAAAAAKALRGLYSPLP